MLQKVKLINGIKRLKSRKIKRKPNQGMLNQRDQNQRKLNLRELKVRLKTKIRILPILKKKTN